MTAESRLVRRARYVTRQLEKTYARRRRHMSEGRRKLGAAIGEMIIAHNFAHAILLSLFGEIVDSHRLAITLTHTQRTDKAQRELVAAAAGAVFDKKRRMLNSINWALSRMNALSEFRNDVVHVHLAVEVDARPYRVLFDSWATPPARYKRLRQEVKLTQSLRTATGDLYKLAFYVSRLEGRVYSRSLQTPLPKRPQLRFVRGKHQQLALYQDTLL